MTIQNIINDELIHQRKQLVEATKKHVDSVSEELRKEIEAIQRHSATMLNKWEEKIVTPRGGQTPRTPPHLMSLDEKVERTRNELENTKGVIEAIWGSIAQLSSKLVDLESEIDK